MEKKIITLTNEAKAMNLHQKEKEILCKLISIADDDGWCYVTVNCLANELHYSTSTVLLFTKLLEKRKLLIERVIGTRYTRTRFKLNLDLLNISSSSNNSTEHNTNCANSFNSNSSIEDAMTLKIKDLENEINKLNKLAKLYIASDKNIDDFKFELKMIVSHKENINFGTRTERAAKAQSKQVGAFKNGELVWAFQSMSEVQSKGFSQGNVWLCCNGKRKTHKGFEWRYI